MDRNLSLSEFLSVLTMSSSAAAREDRSIRNLPLTTKTVTYNLLRFYKTSIPLTLWATLILVVDVTFLVLISGGDRDKYPIKMQTFVVLCSLLLVARHTAADIYIRYINASLTSENNVVDMQMACYKDDNHDIPTLPEDLLVEIFLRSSVKCLMRVQCVCKHWYGLIKDPSFAYQHLHFQKHMKKDRLLLQYFTEEAQAFSYTILDDIPQLSPTRHFPDYLQVPDCDLEMEGPVNGLYCLFNNVDRVVLWNPALMDFKTLPLPPSHFFPHWKAESGIAAFGFDPLTNDYKVVLRRALGDFCDSRSNEQVGEQVFTVYSLSTDTWRLLDVGNFSMCPFSGNLSSSYVSGSYYWLVQDGCVLAFHMGEETFRFIPGPIVPPDDPQYDRIEWLLGSTLTVYEDRVALLLQTNFLVSIWVMLEEGLWIKQFSIVHTPERVCPLGFCGNNSLFFVLGIPDINSEDWDLPKSQTVLYSFSTQEMRSFGPRGCFTRFRTCVYYESLISVNGGTKCKGTHDHLKMVSAFLNGGGPYS